MKTSIRLLASLALLAIVSTAPAQVRVLSDDAVGAFPLAAGGKYAGIELCMKSPAGVIQHAVSIFQGDAARVAKGMPSPMSLGTGENRILVGMIGDPDTEKLAADARIDLSPLKGKWEHFLTAVVDSPRPGVKRALVVIGSDPRGTAYGLMDLTEKLGVSPWTWWADVPVTTRDSVYIQCGTPAIDGPRVKFRGIFINDEDWGLEPWSRNNYDKEHGSIGPRTYEKVFELLLRLKANTLWPAMHEVTKSFNTFRENPKLAGEYGIVMGSSHCEPLLTNNAKEWKHDKNGKWEWETNREGILAFLQNRVTENAAFDNLWTVGMRGIHDSPLPGGGDLNGKTRRLEAIIAAERAMLAPLAGGDASKVPQVFVPYNEVLQIYNNGLKLPDDITLMWVDDNHGWIRRLPNQAERNRSGGGGVYYHLSYWGPPRSYLWLDTTPPAQVWEEMTKAYAYGVDRAWIVNVGDIKSTEKGTEYFLRLAWNPENPVLADQAGWLREWATENFGSSQAGDIAAVLNEYYRLSWGNRPEHIGRSVPNDLLLNPEYAANFMDRCDALYARAASISKQLPPEMQDAYFQLVLYPVSGMSGTAVKVLSARENRRTIETDELRANRAADRSEAAWNRVVADTRRYNEDVAGGKWRGIMNNQPLPGGEQNSSSLNVPMLARKTTDSPRETRPIPPLPKLHLAVAKATFSPSPRGARLAMLNGTGTDGAVAIVYPRNLPALDDTTQSPRAEWRFDSTLSGPVRMVINALPTQNAAGKAEAGGVKIAVRINDGPIESLEFKYSQSGEEWGRRVFTAKMSIERQPNLQPGPQVITVYPMGSDFVLDSVDLFQP